MAINEADRIIRDLARPLSRGEALLFTGAGFSCGAFDCSGEPIPQVRALTHEIAKLLWPDETPTDDLSLPDTYAAGLREARGKLESLVRHRLSVDPDSVTDEHRSWLSMPWRRAYTLNIDDLEAAAAQRYDLPRGIHPFSRWQVDCPSE